MNWMRKFPENYKEALEIMATNNSKKKFFAKFYTDRYYKQNKGCKAKTSFVPNISVVSYINRQPWLISGSNRFKVLNSTDVDVITE